LRERNTKESAKLRNKELVSDVRLGKLKVRRRQSSDRFLLLAAVISGQHLSSQKNFLRLNV
jgi:hypothetical protein